MTTIITSKTKDEYGTSFHAICGNTEAYVRVTSWLISAACINAANRRTKRSKGFANFDAAFAHYKSSAMQAILEAIKAEVTS